MHRPDAVGAIGLNNSTMGASNISFVLINRFWPKMDRSIELFVQTSIGKPASKLYFIFANNNQKMIHFSTPISFVFFFLICFQLELVLSIGNKFECYKCETEIYGQIDDMKKDNCYTLQNSTVIEKCEPFLMKCIAVEYRKRNESDDENKYEPI